MVKLKDLEMTLSWIMWVGPKCHHKCPYMREANRGGEGNVTVEAEIGMTWSQTKGFQQPPDLEEAEDGFSPRALGGSAALPTPRLWLSDNAVKLLASGTVRE